MSELPPESPAATRRTALIRIAVGLAQGIGLWLLGEAMEHKAWPATQPPVFGALAMVLLAAPLVFIGGIGSLRVRTLALWTAGAVVILALLGAHDLARRSATDLASGVWPGFPLMAFTAAGLFIAHHLIEGADHERRYIARFTTYFDIAWKHGFQLLLAYGFTGVFWGLMLLGAALFNLIKIDALEQLLRQPWFSIPVTTAMVAAAIQLTDVRVGLIRGVRTVALTLLAWLTPVLALLIAAFLAALPFTGLDPLWSTRSAAAILLGASAVMIVLINAVYQDGVEHRPTAVLRYAVRLAAVLLIPMIILAAYALALRVGQYGWTPDRVIAAACTVVGACYAVGYALAAALVRGPWMKRLEITNVVAAFVILAVLLAIFTPIADPARISVGSQMARLDGGKVTPDRFDYRFLRFDAGRYGMKALTGLKARGGVVARKADEALRTPTKYTRDASGGAATLDDVVRVYPDGQVLPPAFRAQDWSAETARFPCTTDDRCDGYLIDLNGDGEREVILQTRYGGFIYGRQSDGRWAQVGSIHVTDDPRLRDILRRGEATAVKPAWNDLQVGDRRFTVSPREAPEDRGVPFFGRQN